MTSIETIDFEDDSIEQFGAKILKDIPQTQILDAFFIQCSRCIG